MFSRAHFVPGKVELLPGARQTMDLNSAYCTNVHLSQCPCTSCTGSGETNRCSVARRSTHLPDINSINAYLSCWTAGNQDPQHSRRGTIG